MDDDWESAADKEMVLRPKPTNDVNKWAGEDDDEDVKDSWEDEEEKKDEEKPETRTTPSKKPTKVQKSKLVEQERLADAEEEKRLANLTPEEKLAEKLRIQKIQQESDLKSALETFGVSSLGRSLDSFQPETKEEFKEFSSALSWKIMLLKDSPHYTQFIEDLLRSTCATMPAAELKKIKMCVENLHSEKLKLEKQSKKPAGKGKGRATLRTETDDIDSYQNYGNDYGEDYDDFM